MTISPPAQVDAATVAKSLRATYDSGRTRPLAWREEQLAGPAPDDGGGRGRARRGAAAADLGRPKMEAFAADIGHTKAELRHLAKHVSRWVKPTKVRVPAHRGPGQGRGSCPSRSASPW